ncbi:MAG: hypothetical protein KBH99_11620 [Syntrophobacteraceae bacterium]|nr:hypothetical protein [Syntrophobacteraceae bacterium]
MEKRKISTGGYRGGVVSEACPDLRPRVFSRSPPGCIEAGGFMQCDLEARACTQGAVNCRPSGCIRWEES